MYASTIKTALNAQPLTNKVFRDVVPADRIPGRKNQWGIYVVNTQPSYNQGEHWITIEYAPEYTYYFDPYGLPPTKTILRHLEKTRTKKPILYSNVRIQGQRQTCGYYSIYHTLTRTTHLYSMNVFSNDLDVNDRIVYKLVHQLFKIKE